MYTVYKIIGGVRFPIDNNDPNDKTCSLISPQLELEENAFGSLTFSVPPNHYGLDIEIEGEHFSLFDISDDEVHVYRSSLADGVWVEDDMPVFRGRMLERKRGSSLIYTYVYEGELSYLGDTVQVPAKYEEVRPVDFFKAVLNIHNSKAPANKIFLPGTVTVTDDDTSDRITGRTNRGSYQTSYTTSTWEALTSMQKTLGGFFQIRYEIEDGEEVRYLDYLKEHVKRTPAPKINFGKNLVDYADEWSLADLYTVLYPIGANYTTTDTNGESVTVTTLIGSVNNGNNYVEASGATIAQYGRREKAIEFKGIIEPSNLLRIAQLYLSNMQFDNMVLSLTALDLSDLGVSAEQIVFQEVVVANAAIYGMVNKDFPITKASIPLKNPANAVYTMSTNSRAIRSMSTAIKDHDDAVNDILNDLTEDVAELKKNEEIRSNPVGEIDMWVFGYPVIYYREDEQIHKYLLHPDYIVRCWDGGADMKYWRKEKHGYSSVVTGWPNMQNEDPANDNTGLMTIYDYNDYEIASAGLSGDGNNWGVAFTPYTAGTVAMAYKDGYTAHQIYFVVEFALGTDAQVAASDNSSGVYFGIDENGILTYSGSTGSKSVIPFVNIDTGVAVTGLHASFSGSTHHRVVIMVSTSGAIHDAANDEQFLVGTESGVYKTTQASVPLLIYDDEYVQSGNIPRIRVNYLSMNTGEPITSSNQTNVARIIECAAQKGQITRSDTIENMKWLIGRFITGEITTDSGNLPS